MYSFFPEYAHAFDIYQVYINWIILIKIQADSYVPPCGKSRKFSYPAADAKKFWTHKELLEIPIRKKNRILLKQDICTDNSFV